MRGWRALELRTNSDKKNAVKECAYLNPKNSERVNFLSFYGLHVFYKPCKSIEFSSDKHSLNQLYARDHVFIGQLNYFWSKRSTNNALPGHFLKTLHRKLSSNFNNSTLNILKKMWWQLQTILLKKTLKKTSPASFRSYNGVNHVKICRYIAIEHLKKQK